MKSIKSEPLLKKFNSVFRWNLAGGLFYETTKIFHQIFLMIIMEPRLYGLMGTIFSVIYLVILLTKFGIEESVTQFFNQFFKSKKTFAFLFFRKYFLPQIFIFLFAAIISTFIYSKTILSSTFSFSIIFMLLIFFEGNRIFLRRLLHTFFLSKSVVICDTIAIVFYLLSVWSVYFITHQMNLYLVFIPYLISSIISTIFFISLSIKFYKSLPDGELQFSKSELKDLNKKIIKTRFFNYFLQVSKILFSGNFLTPLFAIHFGFTQAGIFNLADNIAESLKAIMKVTIIFSGNALLARIKSHSDRVKRFAFHIINKNLNIVIFPIIIFLIINYSVLFKINGVSGFVSSNIKTTFSFLLLYLLITLMEYFFLIYEQFYIVEEKANKIFFFKLIEFGLVYILITTRNIVSPFDTLLGLIIIRTLSFIIVATNAYYLWKLKPTFKIDSFYLFIYVSISLLFYLLINFFN